MALDDIQTREPESIIAGDSVAWQRSESRYSPGAGWALVYRLLSAAAVIDIDGAEVTDDGAQTWTIQLAAATTGAYTAGLYSYTAFASKASDRVTLASGRICVEPDPAAASATDARIFAEQILDALEAVLLKRANTDQASYTIQGTSISLMSLSELESWRDKYRTEVQRYRKVEDLRAGRRANSGIWGAF